MIERGLGYPEQQVLLAAHPVQVGAEGFHFVGLPASTELPDQWLNPGVSAEVLGARAVLLGPEPLIGAQRIVLSLDDQRLTLETDGLGPFLVSAEAAPQAAR